MSQHLESSAAAEAGFLGLVRRQFIKPTPLPSNLSLDNQVAIVTGSNAGLGFEASRQLLRLNLSHLIMAVRSQSRGDAAAAKLKAEFPSATISVWILDMESYESVNTFAERCKTLSRIDIVILNAGLVANDYTIVPETGHERTLQVNYLSTALLTTLLIPILKERRGLGNARPPVLSMSGSDTAYTADLDLSVPSFPQFDEDKGFNSMALYSRSKLLLIIFLQKIAEMVASEDVLVNITNPGMTKGTALGDKFSTLQRTVFKIGGAVLGRDLGIGASCYLDSVLVQGKESHGSFTSDWTIQPFPQILYTTAGKEMKEQLWKETIMEFRAKGFGRVVEGL